MASPSAEDPMNTRGLAAGGDHFGEAWRGVAGTGIPSPPTKERFWGFDALI